jgi:hypothetical protein
MNSFAELDIQAIGDRRNTSLLRTLAIVGFVRAFGICPALQAVVPSLLERYSARDRISPIC